ncbi:MAG: DUF5677 domain-containing protein [Pseudonocardiaceae bacterium]
MKAEDSIFLKLVLEEVNKRIAVGAQPDEIDRNSIGIEIASQSESLGLEYARSLQRDIARTVQLRQSHTGRVRRQVAKRLGGALRKFSELLALVEVANRIQTDDIHRWMVADEFDAQFAPPFPIKGLIGGPGAKFFSLNSLHARAVVIAQEIYELLVAGFAEAASARARSLYEIDIIMTIVACSNEDTGYEVSNRYYVSAAIEQRKWIQNETVRSVTGGILDPKLSEWISHAKQAWGTRFFDPYGWAHPALNLAPKHRPTFADLEKHAQFTEFRYLYLEFNDAVHAGAKNTLSRADFRRRYPYSTRAENTPRSAARIGWTTARLLDYTTFIATYGIATGICEWDDLLTLGALDRLSAETISMFKEIVSSYDTPLAHEEESPSH